MDEEVSITIIMTGLESGKTTVINVPKAVKPGVTPEFEYEDIFGGWPAKQIKSYRYEVTSLNFSFKPLAADDTGKLYTVTEHD